MRSEFVRNYGTPLSSDAFSKFGVHDSEDHNTEIVQATKYLTGVIIPNFSQWIDSINEEEIPTLHIPELLHREGINLRYIGLVRMHSCSLYVIASLI